MYSEDCVIGDCLLRNSIEGLQLHDGYERKRSRSEIPTRGSMEERATCSRLAHHYA